MDMIYSVVIECCIYRDGGRINFPSEPPSTTAAGDNIASISATIGTNISAITDFSELNFESCGNKVGIELNMTG